MNEKIINIKENFMKNFIAISICALSFSTSVMADEYICGVIGHYIRCPICHEGMMCPQFEMIQNTVQTPNGDKYNIGTNNNNIFVKLNKIQGKSVCLDGYLDSNNELMVTKISPFITAY
jgi:hypothetical protein